MSPEERKQVRHLQGSAQRSFCPPAALGAYAFFWCPPAALGAYAFFWCPPAALGACVFFWCPPAALGAYAFFWCHPAALGAYAFFWCPPAALGAYVFFWCSGPAQLRWHCLQVATSLNVSSPERGGQEWRVSLLHTCMVCLPFTSPQLQGAGCTTLLCESTGTLP